MATTPRLQIPYPDANTPNWDPTFVAMVTAIDTSLYTPREDRNLIISGGGTLSFTLATVDDISVGTLTWSAAINLLAAVTGYQWTIPAGSINLLDGQIFYITVARAPQTNTTYTPNVGATTPNQPNGDSQILVGIRIGAVVHFRDGFTIGAGQSKVVFDSTGSGGGGSGVTVQSDGTDLVNSPYSTINFTGSGVTTSDVGGIATVDISGGGSTYWIQDISAGGYISYDGPAQVPSSLILTGTPTASTTYTMPDGPWSTTILNQSSQNVIVANTNSTGWLLPVGYAVPFAQVLGGASLALSLVAGNGTFGGSPEAEGDAQIAPYSEGPGLSVNSLGSFNTVSAGLVPTINVWGSAINLANTGSHGVLPPAYGQGYNSVSGVTYWYTHQGYSGSLGQSGLLATDETGLSVALVSGCVYPDPSAPAHNAQLMLVSGAGVNSVAPTIGTPLGDTLVGPGATSYNLSLQCPANGLDTGYSTTHVQVVMQGIVRSSSGITETHGDCVTITFPLDIFVKWQTAIVIAGTQVLTCYSAAGGVGAGTISGVTIRASSTAFGDIDGAGVNFVVTTPDGEEGFDVSTLMDLTIWTDRSLTT